MIKIVSADINGGKTSWMLKDSQKNPRADGFLSIKTFAGEVHSGYDLLHLKTGARQPFIRKISHLESKWDEAFCLADYFSFHKKGFPFAEKVALQAIEEKSTPFYFDEVGPLELKGRGFANLFLRLIESKIDMVVAVRCFLVDDVKKTFSLDDVEIVKPQAFGA